MQRQYRALLLAIALAGSAAMPTRRRELPTASRTCRACGRTTPRRRWNGRRCSRAARFSPSRKSPRCKQRYEQIFAGDGDAAFGDAIFEAVLLDVQKYKPTTFDVPTGNYNAFWLVERDFDNRTSLITDPPDGRMPPVVPAAAGRTMKAYPTQSAEGPEARGLSERCITFGVPDVLAGYNSYYQIVQSPGAVVFHSEKIHDARIVLLDGRPHAPAAVSSWLGDSRGHWDGDTLVVETTNLRSSFLIASDALRLTERFTRVGPNTLHYEITVDDPQTWTRPWTLMIPLKRSDAAHLRIRLPRRQFRPLRHPVRRARGRAHCRRPLTRSGCVATVAMIATRMTMACTASRQSELVENRFGTHY